MNTVGQRKLRDLMREIFKAHAVGFASGAVSALVALLSVFDIVLEPETVLVITKIADDAVVLIDLLWKGAS